MADATMIEWIRHQIRGIAPNVVERKQVEMALRRERDLVSSIMDTSPAGITVVSQEGQIVFANTRAEQVLGLARDEITMRTYNAPEWHITDYDGNPYPDEQLPFRRVMASGKPVFDLRHAIEWPDGRRVLLSVNAAPLLDEAGQVDGMVATVEDITDRVRAEEEIRKLSRAIEQSPSTVVITDQQGVVEYANPRFAQLTGYTIEEVLGETLGILKSGEHAPGFYRELWQTILSGREWRDEFANRKKNGEVYWELASISPVRDANGVITHFVKVAEDITERKRAEEALRQRTAELEARNEELDAFAHTVAHDLQNPLGVIIGFAEALDLGLATVSDEKLKEYLHTIAQYGRKMSNIIDELLLLAGVRQTDVEVMPLDMVHWGTGAQQQLAQMIEEYQAEIIVPAAWPAALGYGPWVEEVWVNYLSNAIKYGGRPPRVELGADPPSTSGPQAGEVEPPWVRFWIRDNGPGLTPDQQARLFVPFTQLAQVRVEGHGLGLSIVRRIVEKLGGQVGVESEGVPGQGSVFSFTLSGVVD